MADDFTKLRIWIVSVDLVNQIYAYTNNFPKEETFSLVDQLRKSSNSVSANIAESTGRYSRKDKVRVLYIARGEIEEVRSHLFVGTQLGYLDTNILENLNTQYNDLKRQLNSYIKYLQTY